MSHVKRMNEPWYAYEWVMSHKQIRHVTHMNESCHTDKSAVDRKMIVAVTWINHVTRVNESCDTYEWDMSHVWCGSCRAGKRQVDHTASVTHMNAFFTCEWVVSHRQVPNYHHTLSSPTIITHSNASSYYALPSVSRIDKSIGLLCKRAWQKRLHSAKRDLSFYQSYYL